MSFMATGIPGVQITVLYYMQRCLHAYCKKRKLFEFHTLAVRGSDERDPLDFGCRISLRLIDKYGFQLDFINAVVLTDNPRWRSEWEADDVLKAIYKKISEQEDCIEATERVMT